jgi:excisionase family DNA binding protein
MPMRAEDLNGCLVTSCYFRIAMSNLGGDGMTKGESLAGDRLHTVAEVAEHMRVSNMTVYRLIKAGALPAVRVGKSYRIRERDLEAYLEASRTGWLGG